jgi:IS1 family transposase
MKPDTICDLVLLAGDNCRRWMETAISGVEAKDVQLDEIWDFIRLKAKTKEKLGQNGDDGDSWTWLAIDAKTKFVLAHAVGLRDQSTCDAFLSQLNKATAGPCQVTSDGLRLYQNNVPFHLGSRVDFAQLVKTYSSEQAETRYSPATIVGADPDPDKVSTSYCERLNISLRMHVERFTRLTNAPSFS